MEKFSPLDKNSFYRLAEQLKLPSFVNVEFLFRMHADVLNSLKSFLNENQATLNLSYVNPFVVTMYLIHDYVYQAINLAPGVLNELEQDEEYRIRLISAVIDKYITNEHLEIKEVITKSKYYPPLSTLRVYLNTLQGLLRSFPVRNPSTTLLNDFMKKCVSMSLCITDLLASGFESEAFSTWRTLHESEAILKILAEHQEKVLNRYLAHMQYGLAYRKMVKSVEETNNIFLTIKKEMAEYNLKSKDMKKYIEYGWLYSLDNSHELRLNFRDGVQKAANLSAYNLVYEMSSEISHSSPLLIYSRKLVLYDVTLINLYESFFRLEKIFNDRFLNSLPESNRQQYAAMRAVYYEYLRQFHNLEKTKFVKDNP